MQKTTMSQHIPKMTHLVEHIVFHFIGKSKALTRNPAFLWTRSFHTKIDQSCKNALHMWLSGAKFVDTEEFVVDIKVKRK